MCLLWKEVGHSHFTYLCIMFYSHKTMFNIYKVFISSHRTIFHCNCITFHFFFVILCYNHTTFHHFLNVSPFYSQFVNIFGSHLSNVFEILPYDHLLILDCYEKLSICFRQQYFQHAFTTVGTMEFVENLCLIFYIYIANIHLIWRQVWIIQ